jgi:hypothetical protein
MGKESEAFSSSYMLYKALMLNQSYLNAFGYRKKEGKLEVFDPEIAFNGSLMKYAFADGKFKLLGKNYFNADLRKIKQNRKCTSSNASPLSWIRSIICRFLPTSSLRYSSLLLVAIYDGLFKSIPYERTLKDLRILSNKYIRKWAKFPPGRTDSYFYPRRTTDSAFQILAKSGRNAKSPNIEYLALPDQSKPEQCINTGHPEATRRI